MIWQFMKWNAANSTVASCLFISIKLSRPCHYGMYGHGGSPPLILNFSMKCGWVVSFMPWLLYSWGKRPCTNWTEGWVGPTANMDALEHRKIYLLIWYKSGFWYWYFGRSYMWYLDKYGINFSLSSSSCINHSSEQHERK